MNTKRFIMFHYFFPEDGELLSECSNENSLNESIVQISEETILTALESSQLQIYDVDYTRPITIEIGANDRPQQDSSIILGNLI